MFSFIFFCPHWRDVQQWLNNSTAEASMAFTQQMEPVSHDARLAAQTSHIPGSVPIPSLGFAACLQSARSRMRHRQQCSLQHSHTHIPVGLLLLFVCTCVCVWWGVRWGGAQQAVCFPHFHTTTTLFLHLFFEITHSKRHKKRDFAWWWMKMFFFWTYSVPNVRKSPHFTDVYINSLVFSSCRVMGTKTVQSFEQWPSSCWHELTLQSQSWSVFLLCDRLFIQHCP